MIFPLLPCMLLAAVLVECVDETADRRKPKSTKPIGIKPSSGLPKSGLPKSAETVDQPSKRSSDTISFGNQGGSCPPPNSCISLTSCKAFAARAKDRSKENAQFLKEATCGFSGSNPLVCCPPETEIPRITNSFPPVTAADEQCGQGSFAVTRVVGGTPATLGDWPWAAAIFVDDHFSCGGTLINHNFILTAGHCVISASHGGKQIPTSSYAIRLGDLDIESENDGGTPITLRLKNAIPHPQFQLSNFHNDIALLQLERPVQYNKFIQPACLPSKAEVDTTFERMGAILVGWGTIGFEKAAASHLQYVPIPIQPLEKCVKAYEAYRSSHPIIPSQLCAGVLNGRRDACQGDSGGPLTIMDPNLKGSPWTLVGVVSYGFKCAEVGFPGVYTRVTSYLDWIEQNTKL